MTSRPAARPSLQRISGPAELLEALPYVLGFHPDESLVLVGLAGTRVVVTARLDLADAQRGGIPYTLSALVRSGSTSVVAVIYDDTVSVSAAAAELPWLELLWDLEADAAALHCELAEAVLVVRGRYWSLVCDDPTCCPPEGREVGNTPTALSAAATFAGRVALPDRAALETLLEPRPDAERAELAAAIEDVERCAADVSSTDSGARSERAVKRAIFAAARAAQEPKWPGVTAAEAVRFGAALRSTPIRDAVWMAVDDGRLDGRPLWRELARVVPVPYDAPPLFLFGWASWRHGDGALARIAADRALRSNSRYTAADLLLAALNQVIDPRRMPRLRSSKSA